MPYPPSIPPATRTNATVSANNHPGDHNALATGLTDIVNELGTNPSGNYPSVGDRLDRVEIRRGCGLVSVLTVNPGQNANFVWESEAWDSDGFHTAGSKTVVIPTGFGGLFNINYEVTAGPVAVSGVCDALLLEKVVHHTYIFPGTTITIPMNVVTDQAPGAGIEASITNGHSVPCTFTGVLVVQWLSS